MRQLEEQSLQRWHDFTLGFEDRQMTTMTCQHSKHN